jgi:Domain of unknown function(DUF2779)
MKKDLSKSKLLAYLQCPRRLYLQVHRPKLAAAAQEGAQVRAGISVGEAARSFHDSGILVSSATLRAAIQETRTLVARVPRHALFEPAFVHNSVLVRVDLLVPQKGGWDLTEVKSSSELEDGHLNDVAIQSFVLEGSGLSLRRVALQHINKQFVYPGGGDYGKVGRNGSVTGLFAWSDVSKEARRLARTDVPKWIRDARKTLAGRMPRITANCEHPVVCEFMDYCYRDGPEYPVSCLPRLHKEKLAALRAKGYADIRDIPNGVLKDARQEWVRQVTKRGKPELKKGAAKELAALAYPRYYVDFETISFVVPIWKGTHPYDQIPFQWSCHIEDKSGRLRHASFLELSGGDPSLAFATALIKVTGTRGPIFVYNQAFEGRIVRWLAERYKNLAKPLLAISKRFVDLLPITRAHYYHPDMRGSWSIKSVLRTIAPELDYADLRHVQDGGGAQMAYLDVIAPETTQARRQELRDALLAYCERDTWAMVLLGGFLRTGRYAPARTVDGLDSGIEIGAPRNQRAMR